MTIDPRQLSARVLRAECGQGAYERGQDYFRRGRARLEECFQSDNFLALFGVNRGSGSNRYHQDIKIFDEQDGIGIYGECSCPVTFNCKHVVALCLVWREQTGQAANQPGAFENWLQRLEQVSEQAAAPAQEALLYLLVPAEDGTVGVEFVVARRKRDGNWGKGRVAQPSTLNHPFSRPHYLQSIDLEMLALLEAANPDQWQPHYSLSRSAGHVALRQMLESQRVFWSRERIGPLQPGPARDAHIHWAQDNDGHRLRVEPAGGGSAIPVEPPCYIDPATAEIGELRLPGGLDAGTLPWLLRAPPVSDTEAARISRRLVLNHPELPPPTTVDTRDVEQPPQPHLVLDLDPEQAQAGRLELGFIYAGALIDARDPQSTPVREVEGELLRIHRDAEAETGALDTLTKAGLVESMQAPGRFILPDAEDAQPLRQRWLELVDGTLRELQAHGWQVAQTADNAFSLSRSETVEAEVESSGNEWFSLRFDLEVDGWPVPLLPLVSQVLDNYRPEALPETLYLDTGEGHYAAVPGAQIAPVLQTILALYDRAGDESLKLSRLDAPRLLDLGDTRVKGAATLQKLARRLRDFDGIRHVQPRRRLAAVSARIRPRRHPRRRHGPGQDRAGAGTPGDRKTCRTHAATQPDRRAHQPDGQLAPRGRDLHAPAQGTGSARTRSRRAFSESRPA